MTGIKTLAGPDVSSYQGSNLDWQAIRQEGADFGWAKASEGWGIKDNAFDHNWAALHDAGLIAGTYHFARFELGNSPSHEAAWFLSCLGKARPYDMVALDLETGTGDLSAPALEWLHVVEHAVGCPPFLYTTLYMAQNQLRDPALAHYHLWLALPNSPCPPSVGVWSEVTMHQHDWASPNYPSIGPCDESVIARTLDGLKALGVPPVLGRVLILVDMRLRYAPQVDKVYFPEQLVYKGAVLNVVGSDQDGWVPVHAGTRNGWVLAANTRRIQ